MQSNLNDVKRNLVTEINWFTGFKAIKSNAVTWLESDSHTYRRELLTELTSTPRVQPGLEVQSTVSTQHQDLPQVAINMSPVFSHCLHAIIAGYNSHKHRKKRVVKLILSDSHKSDQQKIEATGQSLHECVWAWGWPWLLLVYLIRSPDTSSRHLPLEEKCQSIDKDKSE